MLSPMILKRGRVASYESSTVDFKGLMQKAFRASKNFYQKDYLNSYLKNSPILQISGSFGQFQTLSEGSTT